MAEGVKITFNKNQVKTQIHGLTEKAQKKLDSAVLKDSNYFCPEKESFLMKSAILHTVIGSGHVVWNTPYARKQYYGLKNKSHLKNPNATYKWFESAKARKLNEWVEIVKNEYR